MNNELRTQFLARLATLRGDDPLLMGVHTLALDLVTDATAESGRLGLTSDDRAFLDGRTSALQDFGIALASAQGEAQKPQEQ